MNVIKHAVAVSMAVSLCACATWQSYESAPTYRVSRQYTAKGEITGIQAHIYGDRTIVKFKSNPLLVSMESETGQPIEYEKEGDYYRLDGIYDSLLVRSNLFWTTLLQADKSRIPPQNPPSTSANVGALDSAPPVQVRRIDRPTNDDITISKSRMVYVQRFSPFETKFAPSDENGKALLNVALNAKHIAVKGRTDSNVSGGVDRRIARDRALHAKDWLVANGVSPAIISVSSMGAGGYMVPNTTPDARNKNRRVEIQVTTKAGNAQ